MRHRQKTKLRYPSLSGGSYWGGIHLNLRFKAFGSHNSLRIGSDKLQEGLSIALFVIVFAMIAFLIVVMNSKLAHSVNLLYFDGLVLFGLPSLWPVTRFFTPLAEYEAALYKVLNAIQLDLPVTLDNVKKMPKTYHKPNYILFMWPLSLVCLCQLYSIPESLNLSLFLTVLALTCVAFFNRNISKKLRDYLFTREPSEAVLERAVVMGQVFTSEMKALEQAGFSLDGSLKSKIKNTLITLKNRKKR